MKARYKASGITSKQQKEAIRNLIDEELKRQRECSTRRLLKLVCISLHKEFGFGKVRLHRLGRMVNQLTAEGYALNDPPKAFDGSVEEQLADKPLVACEGEGVAVDWVKVAEDGNGVIVRAYEFAGKETHVNISLNEVFGSKKAYLCDLMENIICELE